MLCACAVAAPALPEGATELKDVTAVKAVRVSNSGLNQAGSRVHSRTCHRVGVRSSRNRLPYSSAGDPRAHLTQWELK